MDPLKIISLEQTEDANYERYGGMKLDDAVEVIEEILLLHHSDVFGIQKYGITPRRIDFSVTTEAFHRSAVQDCLDKGEKIMLSSGRIVQVGIPNNLISEVYIKHAPMDWSDYRLSRIFSFYGDIKKINRLEIRSGEITRSDNYIGKVNGVAKLRMKIRRQIPSSIVIDSERIEVYYKGQVPTCFKCGQGHIRKHCKVYDPKEFTNRYSIEDFPPLEAPTKVLSHSAQVVTETSVSEEQSPQVEKEKEMESIVSSPVQENVSMDQGNGEAAISEAGTSGTVGCGSEVIEADTEKKNEKLPENIVCHVDVHNIHDLDLGNDNKTVNASGEVSIPSPTSDENEPENQEVEEDDDSIFFEAASVAELTDTIEATSFLKEFISPDVMETESQISKKDSPKNIESDNTKSRANKRAAGVSVTTDDEMSDASKETKERNHEEKWNKKSTKKESKKKAKLKKKT